MVTLVINLCLFKPKPYIPPTKECPLCGETITHYPWTHSFYCHRCKAYVFTNENREDVQTFQPIVTKCRGCIYRDYGDDGCRDGWVCKANRYNSFCSDYDVICDMYIHDDTDYSDLNSLMCRAWGKD